jgi:hypothetical protein
MKIAISYESQVLLNCVCWGLEYATYDLKTELIMTWNYVLSLARWGVILLSFVSLLAVPRSFPYTWATLLEKTTGPRFIYMARVSTRVAKRMRTVEVKILYSYRCSTHLTSLENMSNSNLKIYFVLQFYLLIRYTVHLLQVENEYVPLLT